jgi:hypothetical protein
LPAGGRDSRVEADGSLKKRLLEWIGGHAGGAERFDGMALDVFKHQFAMNLPYRAYCLAKGADVKTVKHWRDIPALPTDAFKVSAHLPRSFPEGNATRHFLTSGTTTEVRGRHEFEDLDLYEASILAGWKFLGLPDVPNPWFFSQSPTSAPESSLVWMFEVFRKAAQQGEERWLMENADFDVFRAAKEPVQLFSTAIGLLRWMESGEDTRG